jgi:hypothetical protein
MAAPVSDKLLNEMMDDLILYTRIRYGLMPWSEPDPPVKEVERAIKRWHRDEPKKK